VSGSQGSRTTSAGFLSSRIATKGAIRPEVSAQAVFHLRDKDELLVFVNTYEQRIEPVSTGNATANGDAPDRSPVKSPNLIRLLHSSPTTSRTARNSSTVNGRRFRTLCKRLLVPIAPPLHEHMPIAWKSDRHVSQRPPFASWPPLRPFGRYDETRYSRLSL
jgi:hypothetical protein